ncbi:FMN-dependent NADH-azoreductase [Motilimonas pumila]|uniref:FMN dependent NADH:quinone oxidoreductase n=1 Tax=Motilimonas pumila TaxID=2303987 RepID=A0A418Y9B8_9GAMM|nr:NAD(P)H-dependent oxidoreductase [Motilimonas pumila]RJG36919.1 ACP phosphodiesterase [Motilimonas pumila]
MPTILHLDTSARSLDKSRTSRNSISRMLADSFREQWTKKMPTTKVIYRDLAEKPPGFIDEAWIAAAFTPEEQRTAEQNTLISLSDELIDEVTEADMILLSTPMYNYGMPATLKAWFDQVIRVNKTFSFDLGRGDYPLQPTLSGKTMVLMTSCGEFGFHVGGIREKMNHLGPHIEVASQYLGVDKFYEIRCEYQEFGDQRHIDSLNNAHTDITNLIKRLT